MGGRRRRRSRAQTKASKKNIKKAQKKSPTHTSKSNVYTDGRDFDVKKKSAQKFMDTHNRAQRIYMHAILHAPAGKAIPKTRRVALHDKIVRKDLSGGLKEHKTPIS